MHKRFLIFCAAAILLQGFTAASFKGHKQHLDAASGNDTTVFTSSFNTTALAYDSSYGAAVQTGTLNDTALYEASGMVASRKYAELWWVHSDGGNSNDIFLVDEHGNECAVVTLKGCTNRDWEDITIGAGPKKNRSYIYIAETGDNHLKYGNYCLYRLEEPKLALNGGKAIRTEVPAVKISFVYPDGPHNAEALLFDPVTRDLYIVTKSKTKEEAVIYRAAYSELKHQMIVLEKKGVLPVMKVTSGAISPDGREIVIKSLDHIYYWKRPQGVSVAAALKATPVLLPYIPEPQGEAIGWTTDGKALYTTSEKKGPATQRIYKYSKK